MKKAEDIIESYMSFNTTTGRANKRPLKVSICIAMTEYAEQYRRLSKDLAFELGNANEIIKLREKELQAAKDEIFRLQEVIHNTTRL